MLYMNKATPASLQIARCYVSGVSAGIISANSANREIRLVSLKVDKRDLLRSVLFLAFCTTDYPVQWF